MRSVGILNYLEKKWLSQRTYSQFNHLQSNSFQPVEYMHIRFITLFFFLMMIISVLICILENIWYKLQHERKFKKRNSNSILLGTRNNNMNVMKTCYKVKSQLKWRRKFSSLLLFKNREFLQNVTIQINRW